MARVSSASPVLPRDSPQPATVRPEGAGSGTDVDQIHGADGTGPCPPARGVGAGRAHKAGSSSRLVSSTRRSSSSTATNESKLCLYNLYKQTKFHELERKAAAGRSGKALWEAVVDTLQARGHRRPMQVQGKTPSSFSRSAHRGSPRASDPAPPPRPLTHRGDAAEASVYLAFHARRLLPPATRLPGEGPSVDVAPQRRQPDRPTPAPPTATRDGLLVIEPLPIAST